MRTVFRLVVALPIRLYQVIISPLFPSSCNYHPSCSEYGRQAILRHGLLRGGLMAVMRIGRCSAYFHGGNDPVPERFDLSALREEYRIRSVRRSREDRD